MNAAMRLCFTHEGLINPRAMTHKSDIVAIFTDGTEAAYNHLREFDFNALRDQSSHIGLARTPVVDMRLINVDGSLTKPNYVYSEQHRMKWVCANVASPHLSISISDITKENATQAELDQMQVDQVCFLSYLLWLSMRVAEDRLCFPAAVIDRLANLTFYLTPMSMNLATLQRESGLASLDYNPVNDIMSVEVPGDIYTVKMDVLYKFYLDYVLPIFNKLLGRRTRLMVTVNGAEGSLSTPSVMSYGQLGALVEDFSKHVRQQFISDENPLETGDLLAYSKKVRINEESCLWPSENQSIIDLVNASHKELVPQYAGDNAQRADNSVGSSSEREAEPLSS